MFIVMGEEYLRVSRCPRASGMSLYSGEGYPRVSVIPIVSSRSHSLWHVHILGEVCPYSRGGMPIFSGRYAHILGEVCPYSRGRTPIFSGKDVYIPEEDVP
jgi:hypothetical protein